MKFKKKLEIKNYKLIINCQKNTPLSKKFFFNKVKKNYKSFAYTTIIKHKKLIKNDVAIQVFTERGPLAFLPLSSKETSIVFSARGTDDVNLRYWIEKYGKKYAFIKVDKIEKFEIKSNNLRIYYHKNILAFGDLLHQIHPLAGQGFNMTLRDIKVLIELIKYNLNLGIQLDSSVCVAFEKKSKSTALLCSNTSSIKIEEISKKLKDPNRLVGVHFFNPVLKMPLVEIIKSNKTINF